MSGQAVTMELWPWCVVENSQCQNLLEMPWGGGSYALCMNCPTMSMQHDVACAAVTSNCTTTFRKCVYDLLSSIHCILSTLLQIYRALLRLICGVRSLRILPNPALRAPRRCRSNHRIFLTWYQGNTEDPLHKRQHR